MSHIELTGVYHSNELCWGPNGEVCVAADNDLIIYEVTNNTATQIAMLKSHKHRVTGVDWNHGTNQIVSCGEDRNAYVWNLDDGEWRPTLVVLRVNRAALCVKWSPSGNKFAVGTSAKNVMVCHYDEGHDFWVSKSIKKSKSAVTSVSWHPNDVCIAASGTDMKCRIYNASIPACNDDASVIEELFESAGSFGTVLATFDSLGYVNSCAFNADGTKLVYCSQSAQITLVSLTAAGTDPVTVTYQLKSLPYNSVLFDSDGNVVGGGHSRIAYKHVVNGDELGEAAAIEVVKKAKKKATAISSAFSKFQGMSNRGKGSKKAESASTAQTFAITKLVLDSAGAITSVGNGDNHIVRWGV